MLQPQETYTWRHPHLEEGLYTMKIMCLIYSRTTFLSISSCGMQ